MFVRIVIFVALALASCQRPAAPPPQPPGARSSPAPRPDIPDLRRCHVLTEMPSGNEVEDEAWDRAFDECSSVLQRRASHVMKLFHAGDCDALAAFASAGARREESRFIAWLLDELGDARGRALFLNVLPLDRGDALDQLVNVRHMSQFLAPQEGCQPAFCRIGGEPACSPWFGSEAPGACVPIRFGAADGCMPAYCMEAHELLTLAAQRSWAGARSMLVAELAAADGYIWGSLCHCGVRGGIADRDAWEKLASSHEQMAALQTCFADMPGNTTASCENVKEKTTQRTCGQASASALAVDTTAWQQKGPESSAKASAMANLASR
jgi:hypothetical protein